MLSISRSKSKQAASHVFFSDYKPVSLADISQMVATEVWSPITWKDGVRGKKNFQSARLVVLDFDNDNPKAPVVSVSDTAAWCRETGVSFVIGTTKSHQKVKVSVSGKITPAVDRFRLVLVGETVCTSVDQYEYNMEQAISSFGCDPSCKDGARFFWPCTDIVALAQGAKWQWSEIPANYPTEAERRAKAKEKAARDSRLGVIPLWMIRILDGRDAVAPGERHKTCYRLGAQLIIRGWPVERIVEALMKTNLREIGASDVRRAVENGIKASV